MRAAVVAGWIVAVGSASVVPSANAQVPGWPPTVRDVRATCIGSNAALITLGGTWPDTCVPTGMSYTVEPGMIHVRIDHDYPAGTLCGAALTPWTREVRIPSLPPAGGWEVFGRLYEHGVVIAGPTILGGFVPAPTHCPSDVTDGQGNCRPDGGVTIDDLLFFLAMFNDGAIGADFDDGTGTGSPDGGVTIDDLLYFLARFEAGC